MRIDPIWLSFIYYADSRRRKSSHLGCWKEKTVSSHLRWTWEMGSNHLHPMALRIFWKFSRYLFRNGSRPFSYISASKGCSRFCVTKICLYLFSFQATFKQVSSTAVLPFNEPVEAMDYDSDKCKLVLTSHTGKIKLFHIEKNGTKKANMRIVMMLTTLSRNRNINVDQELEWHNRGEMCYSTFGTFYLERRKHRDLWSWIWDAVSRMFLSDASIINMAYRVLKNTVTGVDVWMKVLKSSM